jgi:hypothetical protein
MAALTTNAGEEWIVDKLLDTGLARPEYLQFGTGAAPTETSTALTTAVQNRVLATLSKVGSGDAAVLRIVGTITADASRTITEVGVFTTAGSGGPPATGGTMVFASDHTSTVLANGEGIAYQIDVNPE